MADAGDDALHRHGALGTGCRLLLVVLGIDGGELDHPPAEQPAGIVDLLGHQLGAVERRSVDRGKAAGAEIVERTILIGSAALAWDAAATRPITAATVITLDSIDFIITPPYGIWTRNGSVGGRAISRSSQGDRARPFRRGLRPKDENHEHRDGEQHLAQAVETDRLLDRCSASVAIVSTAAASTAPVMLPLPPSTTMTTSWNASRNVKEVGVTSVTR